jgi:hypothetical protein
MDEGFVPVKLIYAGRRWAFNNAFTYRWFEDEREIQFSKNLTTYPIIGTCYEGLTNGQGQYRGPWKICDYPTTLQQRLEWQALDGGAAAQQKMFSRAKSNKNSDFALALAPIKEAMRNANNFAERAAIIAYIIEEITPDGWAKRL